MLNTWKYFITFIIQETSEIKEDVEGMKESLEEVRVEINTTRHGLTQVNCVGFLEKLIIPGRVEDVYLIDPNLDS